MGRALGWADLQYSDNEQVTVARRLVGELAVDARRLDVATGYFTPGVWSALDQALAGVGRFRLLLGKDFQLAGAGRGLEEEAIQELVRRALAGALEPGWPSAGEAHVTQAWLSFLDRPDQEVDVRVWTEGFLHAKAYLLEQSAGVGSANFTTAGLTSNRELVAWRQDRSVVQEMRDWFDAHWEMAAPYKAALREQLAASRFGTHPYTPYQVLIRTLAERYGTDRPPSLSTAALTLKWFQNDAVFRLIQLLDGPGHGAILADAVGLGKTYMAMGVIQHFLPQAMERRGARAGRPVLVIVPASMQSTWQRALEEAQLDWACGIVTLQSFREETDVRRLCGAGLVVVDEAHRLRGGGVWFRKVTDIVMGAEPEPRVLLLTATPVHTGVRDLANLLRVATKNRRDVWAPAIADFERYLQQAEAHLLDPFPVLDRSVVRRSRSDLLRAQAERVAAGVNDGPLVLPARQPRHVTYQYAAAGDPDVFAVFAHTLATLELAPYDLERFRRRARGSLEGEAGQKPSELVGLFVAGLLKRFESSLRAVRMSLTRLDQLLRMASAALGAAPPRQLDLQSLAFRRQLELEASAGDSDEPEYQLTQWLQRQVPLEAPLHYDLAAIVASIQRDRLRVDNLLAALPPENQDGKVEELARWLTDPKYLGGKRVLVFTQFRDTARYLHERLAGRSGVGNLGLVDGTVAGKVREELARTFDPAGHILTRADAIRVLVSTDVLAEGHNLQLAEAVVNFDLHWNPQVVVQRAGRIDRLGSPHAEVQIVSFLPAEGLDAHLGLVRALDARFGLIHHFGLGDEPVTRFAGDFQATTFEQMRRLYADEPGILDEWERFFASASTDFMRQPLEAFLQSAALERLQAIPMGVQSTRWAPPDWPAGAGTFIALRVGGGAAQETVWRFYPDEGGSPLADEATLFRGLVCSPHEPRSDAAGSGAITSPLIDWDLLRRAGEEVVATVNAVRATAQVARGASRRSSSLRTELRNLAQVLQVSGEALADVLDRLEAVHVEDYDTRPEYRRLRTHLRVARSPGREGERRQALQSALAAASALLGPPVHSESHGAPPITVSDLVLVSWERIEVQ